MLDPIIKDILIPLVGTGIGAVIGGFIANKVAIAVLRTETAAIKGWLDRTDKKVDHAHDRITDHVEKFHAKVG